MARVNWQYTNTYTCTMKVIHVFFTRRQTHAVRVHVVFSCRRKCDRRCILLHLSHIHIQKSIERMMKGNTTYGCCRKRAKFFFFDLDRCRFRFVCVRERQHTKSAKLNSICVCVYTSFCQVHIHTKKKGTIK